MIARFFYVQEVRYAAGAGILYMEVLMSREDMSPERP